MKTEITVLLSLIAMALSVSTASVAEIYKWVDDQGKAHFTDRPPAGKQTEELELKINTYSAVEIKPLQQRLGSKDKVIMYSASWCGMCKKAKRYFKDNNIPHKVYDIENNRVGKREFKLLGGKAVPVILVGSKRMNGFNASRFSKLYEKEIKQKQKTDSVNTGTQY